MDMYAHVGAISTCSTAGGGGPAGTTVTTAGALRIPSLVAVTLAEPGPTPVSRPLEETAATAGSLLAHCTGRRTTRPRASVATARSANLWAAVIRTAGGTTARDTTAVSRAGAAGCVTVTSAVPVWPSAGAVTVAAPGFTPVTLPSPVTLATVESLEVQPTGRGRTCPSPARAMAASATVPPMGTEAVPGVTLTVAMVARDG